MVFSTLNDCFCQKKPGQQCDDVKSLLKKKEQNKKPKLIVTDLKKNMYVCVFLKQMFNS